VKSLLRLIQIVLILTSAIPSFSQKEGDARFYMLGLVEECDQNIYDNPLLSLELAEEAHKIAMELEDDSLVALTLNRIGSAHWSLGNVISALEHIQQSLQIAESKGYREILARNYGNIGNVYGAAGLDLDAISYYRNELTIQKDLNDPFRLFAVNNNIGKAFLDIGYYDSAHFYLEKAGEYLNEEFIHLHSIYYFNLAETHFNEGQLVRTDSLLVLTFENAEKHGSKRGIIRANQLKSELERTKGNIDVAIKHAKVAVEMANESQVKELIYLCHKTLSKCYAEQQKFEQAYYHDQIHEAYLDSVQNVSSVNELELLSYYQRLFRLRVLEQKNALNKKLAEQRQFIIYSLIGVLAIAIFMISVIVRRGQKIRKQARRLEALDAFKNRIFAIVSHDLKSPIQSVSVAVEMFQDKLLSKEEVETHLPELRDKTSRLLDLLNNIFQWAEGQISEDALKKEDFLLVKVLNDLEAELLDRLHDKNIRLEYDKGLPIILHSNRGIVRIVLRNLIVNAIKFSFEKSVVTVEAYEKDEFKIVEIIDRGVGIQEEKLDGLFSMEAGSSIGTSGEVGNGLGLALCYDFIRSLGGKIEVESEHGRGSIFRVHFPSQDA